MKQIFSSLLIISISLIAHKAKGQVIDLAGQWNFRLDSSNAGFEEKWFEGKSLSDSIQIQLPGSCEQRGFGMKNIFQDPNRLTRSIKYEGKTWYQRSIEIPLSWVGKRTEFFLERCHWESTVYIDGIPLGVQNSLSAPHIYDLGILSSGKHIITICIDNSYGKIPIGRWGFAITDDTQGNWNGIIGKIELRATPPVWIKNVQVFADHLQISIGNITGKSQQVTLQSKPFTIPITGTVIDVPFKHSSPHWDEFHPVLQTVMVNLKFGNQFDKKNIQYGNRNITAHNGQFFVNRNAVMMRGPVNECVYPLTGYPPMDKAAWIRVLRISKSYGFNFIRFNSWCPPEAAFEAADELGIFLQVELPIWTIDAPQFGQHPDRDQFLMDELKRILSSYGNHPSFAFMAMGNESPGPFDMLVKEGKRIDTRMLYRCQNGDTIDNGDYAEKGTEIGQRGGNGPRTDWDRWTLIKEDEVNRYSRSSLPTMAHEVGQWSSYPDFDQIKKFTGTLKPYNYERFRNSLAKNNMADEDKAFAIASGKFSVSLYKDEIEGCLRTYPYGGFQIVEARDFPGEGCAIIGWLDAFWDSKGLITPEEFRRFCAPVVCLLRMPKRIFTNGETFEAKALISNYGSSNLSSVAAWKIEDENSHVISSGKWEKKNMPTGKLTSLGDIHASFKNIKNASRLSVTVSCAQTSNTWNIWVYPDVQNSKSSNVKVVYAFDDATKNALANGENVLLFSSPSAGLYEIKNSMLQPDSVRFFPPVSKGKSAIQGSFMPAFWNLRLFNQPGTLSILCNPHHPALSGFPTEAYSDWQWADLLGSYTAEESYKIAGDNIAHDWDDRYNRSKSIILNETPEGYRPIVQMIDNYERNYKLGIIFETRVGKGKLLICSLDLDTDADERPAARQLKTSLLNYAAGKDFNPEYELPESFLEKILSY